MTDPEDLRLVTVPRDLYYVEYALVQDQATEITRLRAERDALRARVETLEGALNPFADEADRYDPVEDDDQQQLWLADSDLCIGHLRAARAALKEKNDGQG